MAGGAGWSKNGIGKSRRSSSRASTPSRFFKCCRIHCAGFSEKRPSRVLPTMTEMTVMLLLLAVRKLGRAFWYQTATWTKLDTSAWSARTHRSDTRAHRNDRPAPRSEHRRLPHHRFHSGARRRQVDRADRRPARRWPKALQRDQANGRRYLAEDAYLHAAGIGARRPSDADGLPHHAAARRLRIDQARRHLVAGRRTAQLVGARSSGRDPHIAGTVRPEGLSLAPVLAKPYRDR